MKYVLKCRFLEFRGPVTYTENFVQSEMEYVVKSLWAPKEKTERGFDRTLQISEGQP